MLKKAISEISYDIDVKLLPVMDEDSRRDMLDESLPSLHDLLDDLPYINEVDYNGHFGNYLFIKIDPAYDNEVSWMEIEKIYLDYIKGNEDDIC